MKPQDIIALLLALAGCAGFFILFAAFLVYAFVQSRKRQRIQKELIAAAPQSDGGQNFPVKYAGEKKFKSFFKVFPWEASGVLRLTDTAVLFQGAKSNGQPIELTFNPRQTRASYIGIKLINGATAWFMLEQEGNRHYFTAETGVTVFGTRRGSKEIVQAISEYLAAALVLKD